MTEEQYKLIVKPKLTKQEEKVYLELLDKIDESSAMQNFIDFLLWKYDDIEKVTLTIGWKVENAE